MKNIILFTLLLFPLLGFCQDNRDSIIILNPEKKSVDLIQTNPIDLINDENSYQSIESLIRIGYCYKAADNLIDAGKSYKTADNLLLLGITSTIVGSLIYTKDQKLGLVFILGGVFLNINSLFGRYNGHRNIKESGENLKNYTKFLK